MPYGCDVSRASRKQAESGFPDLPAPYLRRLCPPDDKRIKRKLLATLRVGRGIAERDQRVRNQAPVEVERLDDNIGAKQRRAHPAGVQAELVRFEQQILYRRAQA